VSLTEKARQLRIVYMGTPGFAVEPLKALLDAGCTIVGVITALDKPAGRGQQLQPSEVKTFALSRNLTILQPEKLKNADFLAELKALNADLQIVVAFRMLPEVVWNMPRMGTFNLHASLLPRYRGAAPINRAIMNGDTETGVTTFFLQQEIDTGNIAFREAVPIGATETAGQLHDKLMHLGAALVVKTVNAAAEGNCPKIPQQQFIKPGEQLPDAPKLFREDGQINWQAAPEQIINQIRGLSPYPAAWTELHTETAPPLGVKIYNARFESAEHTSEPGTAVCAGAMLKAAVKGGYIVIEELQAAGKKRMPVTDFLRGYRFPEKASFKQV
jgi:methionyl-tRNA formyltransferase